MEAVVSVRDGVSIIELQGRMSFDSVDRFRARCLNEFLCRPIIFNLMNLSFVGSNGISTFLETLQELARSSQGLMRLCHVGSEFRRIFEANGLSHVGFFDNEDTALRSFFVSSEAPVVGCENYLLNSADNTGLDLELDDEDEVVVERELAHGGESEGSIPSPPSTAS